jgi:PPOX class probable F420-dependent enzyme
MDETFLSLPAKARNNHMDEISRFVGRHASCVLVTRRKDDGLQVTPISLSTDSAGGLVATTSALAAKARNIQRDPRVALCLLSPQFFGPWITIEGTARVIEMPDAFDRLLEFHRRRDNITVQPGSPEAARLSSAWAREQKVLLEFTPERVTKAPR